MRKEHYLPLIRTVLGALIIVALVSAFFLFLGYVPNSVNKGMEAGDRAAYISNALGSVTAVVALAIAALLGAEQISSELKDRAKDRTLAAKRDIIVDGIRGLQKMMSQIGRVGNPKIHQSDISNEFTEGVSLVAPMFAVITPDTVCVLQDLSDDIGSNYTRLLIKRVPIASDIAEVEFLENQIRSTEEQQDRMLEELRKAETINDSAAALRLHQMLEASREDSRRMHSELDEPRQECSAKIELLLLDCFKQTRRIRNKFRRALAELRVEIGIDENSADSLALFVYATQPDDELLTEVMSTIMPQHKDAFRAFLNDADVDGAFSRETYPTRNSFNFLRDKQ